MFQKVLIANRGEIAVRIIQACRDLGMISVAVYSEADREALHAQIADEAVCIGPARAADSYLNMDNIISAALASGCQAIHPGFGFLSENPDFAERTTQAGLAFIGPTAATIRLMGDKSEAKRNAIAAGVPVAFGTDGPLRDFDEASPRPSASVIRSCSRRHPAAAAKASAWRRGHGPQGRVRQRGGGGDRQFR